MQTGIWTDAENDATVRAYLEMLRDELAGLAFNKAERRRSLMQSVRRPEKAIEFKHQNISAVLLGLGHPWIEGYKPASNFQLSLVDAVVRQLNAHGAWLTGQDSAGPADSKLREPGWGWSPPEPEGEPIRFGPPPTLRNEPASVDPEKMSALARRFDVAERDARNRALGAAGEQRILEHERATLRIAGRADLSAQVRWTSNEEGDGAGYDIASFEPDGTPRLIEVKTTNGWDRTPFHITRNELAVAEARREHWCLVRLWNFIREPAAFELRPPLSRHVELMPTSFLASLI